MTEQYLIRVPAGRMRINLHAGQGPQGPNIVEAEARTVGAIVERPEAQVVAAADPERRAAAMARLALYQCRLFARSQGMAPDLSVIDARILRSAPWVEVPLIGARVTIRAWPAWASEWLALDRPRQGGTMDS